MHLVFMSRDVNAGRNLKQHSTNADDEFNDCRKFVDYANGGAPAHVEIHNDSVESACNRAGKGRDRLLIKLRKHVVNLLFDNV